MSNLPFDILDVKSAIPPGEDIIYSEICKCTALVKTTKPTTKLVTSWISWFAHTFFLLILMLPYSLDRIFRQRCIYNSPPHITKFKIEP